MTEIGITAAGNGSWTFVPIKRIIPETPALPVTADSAVGEAFGDSILPSSRLDGDLLDIWGEIVIMLRHLARSWDFNRQERRAKMKTAQLRRSPKTELRKLIRAASELTLDGTVRLLAGCRTRDPSRS